MEWIARNPSGGHMSWNFLVGRREYSPPLSSWAFSGLYGRPIRLERERDSGNSPLYSGLLCRCLFFFYGTAFASASDPTGRFLPSQGRFCYWEGFFIKS